MQHDLEKLITIPELVRRYRPAVTESSIRWQIRNRGLNGLERAGCVTKRSGRWLIHVDRYAGWLMGGEARAA